MLVRCRRGGSFSVRVIQGLKGGCLWMRWQLF